MGAAFTLASFIIGNLPGWISSGMDVWQLYQNTKAVIDDNKGPGADAWNALDAKANELSATIHDTSYDRKPAS